MSLFDLLAKIDADPKTQTTPQTQPQRKSTNQLLGVAVPLNIGQTRIAQEKKMQSPEKKSRNVIIPVINNVQEQSESLDSSSPCAVESNEDSIEAV